MPVRITDHPENDPPICVAEGLEVRHPNLPNGRSSVVVLIESAIAPPRDDEARFLEWVTEEATAAIRTKDDGIARRPSIWPDGSEHSVYRIWHLRQRGLGYGQVSVCATAPKSDGSTM